ncbi:MAG TPA: tetratricopeptide repeat protein [Dongiaceae bacterium]|jgi:tetratricopeptide (TPR) repeat protein|nr:tetratricopeptide repeat protein [Dongiaceae bacterium]
MNRPKILIFLAIFAAGVFSIHGQSGDVPLVQKKWFETSSAHFNIYSCGAPLEVNRLAARLDQFCEAYSLLAGTQALASPPIVVMAFPNQEAMTPFLPLYQGKPGNLSGFFTRGEDENLIVLALPSTNSAASGMEVIFHEYTHLLLRRNDEIWPLWLKEGMAEMYSTFETHGSYYVRIGLPIDHHLQLLAHKPLMPLRELFSVANNSPQYNERSRQGIFYAESWLLTHFLMAGGNLNYRSGFDRFNIYLRDGQLPEQAFTNAMRTSLPQMENDLRHYLERGRFAPVEWNLSRDISAPEILTTHAVTPVEVYFRLGDELFRINRPDDAGGYFAQARQLAPASPLPYEGLGLLAAERGQHAAALLDLRKALQLNSSSFLAHYSYAREKYRLTANSQEEYVALKNDDAAEIRGELQKSISLMPDFAPAHELLGFFEMVQGENLPAAEQQLQLAIKLEPENQSYLFTLAQAQWRGKNPDAARRTLGPLLLPVADAQLRAHAEEMIREMGGR